MSTTSRPRPGVSVSTSRDTDDRPAHAARCWRRHRRVATGTTRRRRRPSSAGAGRPSAPAGRPTGPRAAPRRRERASVRLNGLVEAVDFYSVVVPRVTGSGGGQQRLTDRAARPKGTLIKKGDVLVEFDRQLQLRAALDKRAEWLDLEEQIKKKRADQNAPGRRTKPAQVGRERRGAGEARDPEEPDPAAHRGREEHATLEAADAKLAQLQVSLRAQAEGGRGRPAHPRGAARSRRDARCATRERNAEKMVVRAPIDGLVVLKSIWKGDGDGRAAGRRGDVARRRAPRPRRPELDARAGAGEPGRPRGPARRAAGAGSRSTRIRARPIRRSCCRFRRSPCPSQFSQKVRTFAALFAIDGSDPQLAPDLSAAVDVQLQ